eukprot:gene32369-3541_t
MKLVQGSVGYSGVFRGRPRQRTFAALAKPKNNNVAAPQAGCQLCGVPSVQEHIASDNHASNLAISSLLPPALQGGGPRVINQIREAISILKKHRKLTPEQESAVVTCSTIASSGIGIERFRASVARLAKAVPTDVCSHAEQVKAVSTLSKDQCPDHKSECTIKIQDTGLEPSRFESLGIDIANGCTQADLEEAPKLLDARESSVRLKHYEKWRSAEERLARGKKKRKPFWEVDAIFCAHDPLVWNQPWNLGAEKPAISHQKPAISHQKACLVYRHPKQRPSEPNRAFQQCSALLAPRIRHRKQVKQDVEARPLKQSLGMNFWRRGWDSSAPPGDDKLIAPGEKPIVNTSSLLNRASFELREDMEFDRRASSSRPASQLGTVFETSGMFRSQQDALSGVSDGAFRSMPANLDELEALEQWRVGTLTPIVPNPDEAFLSEEMRAVIRQLAVHFPTAIISGRGREKVEGFVKLKELFYAGSHGMDIAGPK